MPEWQVYYREANVEKLVEFLSTHPEGKVRMIVGEVADEDALVQRIAHALDRETVSWLRPLMESGVVELRTSPERLDLAEGVMVQ